MMMIKRNRSVPYIFILLMILIFQGRALAVNYPDAITDFSGGATYCQNDAVTDLSVTFSTCRSGNNQPASITVTWFSNTVNATTGGTQVAQTSSNTLTTTFTYSPSTVSVGTLYYYVEITWTSSGDPACGNAGLLITSTQTVIVNPSAPAQPGTITGPTLVSASTSGLTYGIAAVTNATSYTWAVPSGWSIDGGQGTISISATSGTSGGDVTVYAENSCGQSSLQTLGVTIESDDCPESTSVSPSAIQTLCQGDASNLLTAAISTSGGTGTPTLQYQWYYNTSNSNTVSGATLIGGATSNTYTPLTTASELGSRWYFCVGYATDNGCGQSNAEQVLASNAVEVTVNPPQPATPGAITGTTPVAPSTGGLVYSISTVPNATTYTWDVPTGWTITGGQGTTSITATSGTVGQDGDITVSAGNSCGTSALSSFSVTVEDIPSSDCPESTAVTPPEIQNLCTDDPAGLLTAAITTSGGTGTPTLQYQWYYNTTNSNTVSGAVLIPGATNGTYTPLTTVAELGSQWYFCVGYATDNGCAQDNTIQILASNAVEVSVTDTPVTPGSITGSDNVNPSTPGLNYSIAAVPAATSYTWTVPTGWTITGGQGTTAVTVTSGTLGQDGDITVTANNLCGTSAASIIAVTITEEALPPTITLGGNPTVCQGTTSAALTYSATTESPDQYSIDYPAASEAEGFVDVVNASLPASPITIVVPGGAAAGTYDGNLTVRNSGTGLSSGSYSISVTISDGPPAPGIIFGSTSVPESTSGLSYGIVEVPEATTYTWTVPTGWTITDGQGTATIIVTSGTAGQNGDITVTAGNSCGTSPASVMAVTSETPSDHSVYGCNACHITHDALGGSLTNTLGNSNLCLSCHVTSGAASAKPFTNADKAIPGTSGSSHAWDVPSANSTFETVLTTDPGMLLRVDADNNDNITCSTCHNQHNSNTNLNYTRISNAGDAMCKDCHSPRNVGRYVDNTSLNRGSHPVGLAYSGTGDLEPAPTGSAIIVGGNIECSSCHQTHYAFSSDGMLLRQANNDALCTSCHMLGSHHDMGCNVCHRTHNTDKSNIYMIRNTVTTPSSGDKTVVFTALTGTNSFADGDATYDGICEVCHTSTLHYRNDGSASDQDHTSSGGPMDGQNCTSCHLHNEAFAPQCDDCHNATAPTFGSAVHVKHKDTYGYTCSTCHFQYGSNGTLEGSHPSGTIDVNFDPGGMATRNGQDAITPVMNGDNTCDNMYCHSNGRSAYRGEEDNYSSDPYDADTNPDGLTKWSSTTGPQSAVYATTPVWGTGTITTCIPCHSGAGNMTDPYTITIAIYGSADPLPPFTGSHRRGAHVSNSQELSGNGWSVVNCFWCHNTDNGDDGSPIHQGTYGTSFHVDGTTYFNPRSVVDGGTTVNNTTGGSFSYSLTGTSAHCGDGKACW